jgi:hypothetical protein
MPSGLAINLSPFRNRLFDGDGLDVFQANRNAGYLLLFAKAEFVNFDGRGFAFSTKLRTDLLPFAVLLPSKMPMPRPPKDRCHLYDVF